MDSRENTEKTRFWTSRVPVALTLLEAEGQWAAFKASRWGDTAASNREAYSASSELVHGLI